MSTAGGPRIEGEEVGRMIVRGRRIDAEKALRQAVSKDGTPSVVPKNWELVTRHPDGHDEVVANGVIGFDLYNEGVVWTNGTAIFQRAAHRATTVVERGRLIDAVTVLAA